MEYLRFSVYRYPKEFVPVHKALAFASGDVEDGQRLQPGSSELPLPELEEEEEEEDEELDELDDDED